MKLINEKYRALKPSLDYLTDEVVIAQAWKKTHGFIRSFNWYADTLALDISALTIEENAKLWAKALKEGKSINDLELVPAAKSEEWGISKNGWSNTDKRTDDEGKIKLPLRPLAHLTVRDQTWATAAMMCLADAVETAQGKCEHFPFELARSKKVYSYGNRLLCDWNKDDEAWFRWGNSETYRKFFTDYQNFLNRPLELGREVENVSSGSEDVYVVNLDLSKFYNTIDIELLIERLQELSTDFGHEQVDEFWGKLKGIFAWKWRTEDLKTASHLGLNSEAIKLGLPQGLVSAGFFANAYLNNFDKEVGRFIGNQLGKNSGIVLHDYCRYVDDLRLVVSADNQSISTISKAVNKFIKEKLSSHGGESLKINYKKTKVNLLSDLDNKGSMSNRIKLLQSELSGPTDRDSIDSITGVLENLLTIENESLSFLKDNTPDASLLSIANFDHDIRPDTLKRFAANRLESIVRSKRKMSFDTDDTKVALSESENELLAKKLIVAWMKDPSLGLVLRKAIEVYPDADLFEPVFESIYQRSSFSGDVTTEDGKTTAAMMDYLLADLFRCASDFNGYFQVIKYPAKLEPFSVIELLVRYAQKIIPKAGESTFVQRQALMLLAVVNKPVLIELGVDSIQQSLHKILANNPDEYQSQRAALFEVAGQITGHFDTYASLFIENISSLKEKRVLALAVFAKRGGPFWLALWKQLKKQKQTELISLLKWAEPATNSLPKPRKQLLSKVITSDLNGFRFEHGAVKLALGLLELVQEGIEVVGSSPTEVNVRFDENTTWENIWNSYVRAIICSKAKRSVARDPRFEIPYWVDKESDPDKAVLYWVGCILRASVLGGADYTGTQWKASKTVTYKGLRSSWYKRRMGMIHAPEALIGEYATVSDWFSDLLMRCLQWPGFESSYVKSDDVQQILDLDSFKACLEQRLEKLNNLICNASELPALPTEVYRPNKFDNGFRIVTVQQILPKSTDFNTSDVELNQPRIRAKHRGHLASICSLTLKTLEAKRIADEQDKQPSADLIVFPEVAVHIDDQDLLKRLADKTKSIIFAGLVFTDHKGKLVNIARWFIPDYRESGRQWVIRDQGKHHMTKNEIALGISSHRPCQHILEIHGHSEGPFRITGAICYDATDINLAADLRDKTDLFVVAAHNRDVNTFDNMASALQWHMYQHVVICNIGEFGGSTIQAPYKQQYDKLISHVHGVGQISINTADIDLAAFRRRSKIYKEVKAKPAGLISL